MKNIVEEGNQNKQLTQQNQLRVIQYTNDDTQSEHRHLIQQPQIIYNQNISSLSNITPSNAFKNAHIYSHHFNNIPKEIKSCGLKQTAITWLRKQKQMKLKKQNFAETYRQTVKNCSLKDRQNAERYAIKQSKKQPQKQTQIKKNIKQFQFMWSNSEYYVSNKLKGKNQNAYQKAEIKSKQLNNSQSRTARSHSKYTQKASQRIVDQKVNKLMGVLCKQAGQKIRKETLQKSKEEGLRVMRTKISSEKKRMPLMNLEKEYLSFLNKN